MAHKTFVLTIANGSTTSDIANIGEFVMFQLECPSAMTGASFTFQVRGEHPGSSWQTLSDQDGGNISITTSGVTGETIGLDAAALEVAASHNIRIVSASAEGAERVFYLHAKR